MKTHHWAILGLTIILLIGLMLWPNISSHDVQADELTGTWIASIINQEGQEWFMNYTFKTDGSYTVETSDPYHEEGTYVIVNRFLDGSVELTKTYEDGQKTYTMILTPGSEPNSFVLEGVLLKKQ